MVILFSTSISILISILFLGFLVYLRDRKSATNKTFFAFMLSLVFWMFFMDVIDFQLFKDEAIILYAGRLAHISGFFMASLYFHFCRVFPKRKYRTPFWEKMIYLSGFIFIFVVLLTNLVFPGVREYKESETFLMPSKIDIYFNFYPFLLTVIWLSSVAFSGIGTLIWKLKKAQGLAKIQLQYLFLGTTLFAIYVIFTNLIIGGLIKGPMITYLGPYGLVFFIGFTTYAIIKHRLLDIRLVFVKSLVYSLLILSIASIYVLVIFYLIGPIKETFNISPNLTFVLTGFLIVFGFNPFKRLIEKLTDKFFYKGRYQPGKLLERLGKIMNSTLLLEPLVDSLLKTILKEMKVTKGAFVLTSSPEPERFRASPKLKEVKEIGYQKVPFSSWKKLTSFLQTKALLVRDELEEESKEKSLLRELDISVIVSFLMEKEPVGLLVLGEKKSGDMYTLQDLNFLEALSPQVSIALHNALLFKKEQKKVLELNSLNKLSSALVKTLDLQTLLDQVISQALQVTGAQSGSIMLLNEETQTLSIKASQGIPQEIVKETSLKLGAGIAGYVAKEGEPLILSKNKKSPFKEELKRAELTSSLTVPLKTKEKVGGVLNINRKEKEPFQEEDLNLILSFAAQAAVAIENARLYTEAITDGLTALYNHNYFQLKLADEVTQAQRNSLPLSLLMIDIDHFKDLNDTFGHQKGDLVLKELSKILKSNISSKDIASRYGGEEFAIILPQKEINEAEDLAETLRKKVETDLIVTISIGVSSLPQILKTLKGKESPKETLIRKADEALYLAKQSGRNQVKTFEAEKQPLSLLEKTRG